MMWRCAVLVLFGGAAIAAEPITVEVHAIAVDKPKRAVLSEIAARAVQRAQMETKASIRADGSMQTWCEPSGDAAQRQPLERLR